MPRLSALCHSSQTSPVAPSANVVGGHCYSCGKIEWWLRAGTQFALACFATGDQAPRSGKISELFVYDNFSRVPVERVEAGDICAFAGLSNASIGETINNPATPSPLPSITVRDDLSSLLALQGRALGELVSIVHLSMMQWGAAGGTLSRQGSSRMNMAAFMQNGLSKPSKALLAYVDRGCFTACCPFQI